MNLPRQNGGVARMYAGYAFKSGVNASKPVDRGGLSRCLQGCGSASTLDGAVKCSDFCHCYYETANGFWGCLVQMVTDAVAT